MKKGEHQLLIAVLEDAIHCYQRYLHAGSKNDQQIFRDAEQWIMCRDATAHRGGNKGPGFSFENVCDLLGISADYLRAGLRRWRDAQRVAAGQNGRKA